MKKIFIDTNVMKNIVEVASLFSTVSNAQITFCFGKNVHNGMFLNTMRIVAGTEQLNKTFFTPVPEGYEAVYENVEVKLPDMPSEEQTEKNFQKVLVPYLTGTFKITDFVSTVGILLTSDETVCLKVSDNGICKVGTKDESVVLQLEFLAEKQKSMPIIFNKEESLLNIKFAITEYVEALRTGGCMVESDVEDTRGYGNVLLAMQYDANEKETVEGKIKVYSTNGVAISYGECAAFFQGESSMQQKMTEILEKRKMSFFVAGIPKKSYIKLLKLLRDAKVCYMMVSEKHICMMINNDSMFTFVQGKNITTLVFTADKLQKEEKKGFNVVCDTENFKSKVDILNKVCSYKKFKSPLLLTIKEKVMELEIAGKKEVGVVKIPLNYSCNLKDKKTSIFFDGERLSTVISFMKKGNITLGCAQPADYITYPVQFSTGENDNTEAVFLFPVAGKAEKEESEEQETQGLTSE